MPPIIPGRAGQLMQQIAGGLNGVREQASQQDSVISAADGQAVLHTGVLQQYPPTGTNYTSGYGFEVLSDGAGSPPVVRAGLIVWTSPSGGTVTVMGLAFCDSNGLVRAVMDNAGWRIYGTTGALVSTVASY